MASTSPRLFLQTPPPPANSFFSGENPVMSPSSVKFSRQSSNVSAAAATYAYVETEYATSPSSGRCSTVTMPAPASFYEILGIQRGATIQEIKAAYRGLARVCHPDVAAIDQKEELADEFMKVNAAYCTLSDPKKRAQYDRSLFRRSTSINLYSDDCAPSTPMSGFNGYTTRNWETDQCW